jgi:hypothetical protein
MAPSGPVFIFFMAFSPGSVSLLPTPFFYIASHFSNFAQFYNEDRDSISLLTDGSYLSVYTVS